MKLKIQELIKSISRHQKQLQDPQIMHPERDWSVGIFLVVIIFLGSATWSTHIYLRNTDVSDIGLNDNTSSTVVYRENTVKDALNKSTQRAEALQAMTSGLTENVEIQTIDVASTSEATSEEISSSTEPVADTASSTEG